MRVLFASTRGAGHFNPLVPFVEASIRGGHEVLVVGPPSLAPLVETRGYPFRAGADPPDEELGPVWARVPDLSPHEQNVVVIGEIFARLNVRAMLPHVRDVLEGWAPDLVLRDPAEFASALAAAEARIPHGRVACGLGTSEDESLRLAAVALDEAAGSSDRTRLIRASPFLTLFPASVDDPALPGTLRFREPTAESQPARLPDWWDGDERPLAYVTFGSVTASLPIGAAVFALALDAVAGLPARVLLTVGPSGDPDALGPLPENVHVERWVPQTNVLAHAAVVVGHGGAGTTLGALAAGVPQVVVPLFADQPANARRIDAVGAGVAVEPDAAALRAAVERVLADDAFAATARRVADELRALPPVDDALRALAPS